MPNKHASPSQRKSFPAFMKASTLHTMCRASAFPLGATGHHIRRQDVQHEVFAKLHQSSIHTTALHFHAFEKVSQNSSGLKIMTAVATISSRNSCESRAAAAGSSTYHFVRASGDPCCSDIPVNTACVHLNNSEDGLAHDRDPLRDPLCGSFVFPLLLGHQTPRSVCVPSVTEGIYEKVPAESNTNTSTYRSALFVTTGPCTAEEEQRGAFF